MNTWLRLLISCWLSLISALPVLGAGDSTQGGTLLQPAGVQVIPDRFLRRWDAVTFFYDKATGPNQGGPEDHPEKFVAQEPIHPGAYTWINSKTLQFRPAEPWPPLVRIKWRLNNKTYELPTLMDAPTGSEPPAGATNLAPLERVTLTFAEPVNATALHDMLRIGVLPLPGIDANQARWLDSKDFDIKVIERTQRADPAGYTVQFHQTIPTGMRVILRLKLALEEGLDVGLKELQFATAEDFRVTRVSCAQNSLPITPQGVRYGPDQALPCGGDGPQLRVEFSAETGPIDTIALRNLLRFTPRVEDLRFHSSGRHVAVEGRFQTDTLYRLTLLPSPIIDKAGRALVASAASEGYVYFPPKPRYLRWQTSGAIVERYGPQSLPLEGRGFEQADLRVYPVEPLNREFWPFPSQPISVDENAPPPGPGEEPPATIQADHLLDSDELALRIRTLGSPPISTLVSLPLQQQGPKARFGIDLQPYLTKLAGAQQPGTYLVGIRRLDGSTQRDWQRVQVTDLALTTVEEEDAVTFAVTSLRSGRPIGGADIRVEGSRYGATTEWVTLISGKTGGEGTYRWPLQSRSDHSTRVLRLVVQYDKDILVLDPSRPPDRYADNRWDRSSGGWLQWTQNGVESRREKPQLVCHVFTERPVYRPEEPVYVKAFIRRLAHGRLSLTERKGTLHIQGPGDLAWRYPLDISQSGSIDKLFDEKNLPTGEYHAAWENGHGERCGEMRFQKEAYRIPDFEIQLSTPDNVPLDREFQVGLVARYYAGGQVANRPLRWRVTQFPYNWSPPQDRPGYFFSSDARFSGQARFQSTPTLNRDDTTDTQGAARLSLNPASEPTAQPRSYVIEATVTGADDQTVTHTKRVIALPPVILGLQAPRYLEKAKSVQPKIIALDHAAKNLAGQSVTLRLLKREWHSYLQAGDFSQAEAKYVTEVVDQPVLEQTLTTSDAPLVPQLPLSGAGIYVIEISTADSLGRAQTVAVDFYAGGDEPVTWSRPPSDVFKVTPDQSHYAPGDTARLILESPFQQAQAWAIIETPDGNRYQWVTVKNGAATLDVPIERHDAPRLPVHVVLMRGRVTGATPSPGSRLDLAKPATVAATTWLTVDPVDSQLSVGLTHPQKALPGQTIEMTINLRDPAGKAASGEVALWLVDQAVLSLGKEQRLDPLPDFIRERASRLGLEDTRNWTVGVLPLDEDPGGDMAGSAEGSLLDRTTLRRDFKSVPFYEPSIKVGPDGKATVKIKLPDNLTVFQVRAKAVSGADRFGYGRSAVAIRLPVLVQPALPRFARPGDRFTASALARVVEGEGGAGLAQIQVTGAQLEGAAQRTITLAADQPQRVDFPVTIPTPPLADPGQSTLHPVQQVQFSVAVQRNADQARDAFAVTLPLRPDRHPFKERKLVELQPGQPLLLPAIEEAARPGTLRRRLWLSQDKLLVRLATGLNYLFDYPYTCTEQRLSRASALLALKDFTESFFDAQHGAGLNQAVNDVMAWLPSVVDAQGLVSFWPGSTGYVSLSAWTLEFLVAAARSGIAIDEVLAGRITAALKRALRSDYRNLITGEEYSERVMALQALATAGQLDQAYLAELLRRADFLDLESTARLLSVLNASPSHPAQARQALQQKLWDSIVLRKYQGRDVFAGFQGTTTVRNNLILPSDTRNLAEIIRAVATTPATDTRLPILIEGLVNLADPRGWGTTNANAAAMSSLAAVIKPGVLPGPAQTVSVRFAGASESLVLGDTHPMVRWHTTQAGSGQLMLTPDSAQQPVQVVMETQYLPAASGSETAAIAQGFAVQRTAQRVNSESLPTEKFALDRAGQALNLSVGDVLEEHVEVVNGQDRNHVAVTVPLAAGLEPLNPTLATAPPEAKSTGTLTQTPSYVAYLDDQMAFYYDTLPKGTYHFYFRTRATVPGTFSQPPARAEMMYDDTVYGTSSGARVEVSTTPVP